MRSVLAVGLSLGLSCALLVNLPASAAKTARHTRSSPHPIVQPAPRETPPAWYGYPRYPGYAPISPSPYRGPDPATQGTG